LNPEIPVSVCGVSAVRKHRLILGARVRIYRKLSRLTQEKLAEKAGLAPTYISDVERGRENISVDALARIAKALGVGLADLFEGS
jgi:transcriptional regulator with XRE-family HTH domain